MTSMTMGQRLSAQRKLKGMSQEALAEQLNVSRQAVSKWESDAAVPELDKLIALARIFCVSVGWLLGTEEEPGDSRFTETQIRTVEQIVANHRPRHIRPVFIGLALCLLLTTGLAVYSLMQTATLSAQNMAARDQIAQLSQTNQQIQSQIDRMSALLQNQAEENKLLSSHGCTMFLSEDGQNAQLRFYLTPKVYQENSKAYILVKNLLVGGSLKLECSWDGERYMLSADLPLLDGYSYSFLLVSDNAYREQVLGEAAFFHASDLYSGSRYHILPTESKYLQLQNEDAAPMNIAETTFRYNVPIHAPYIHQKNGLVGYKDVVFRLLRNGVRIWEESCKDRLREHGGVYMNDFSKPFMPEIEVSLPKLAVGDILELEMVTMTHKGLELTTKLDKLQMVDAP